MKKGFTLMELFVYMAIMGIIVVVAGQAFSNSTKFRVRTQNILRATQEAENVATSFRDDVGQMGAKSSKEATVAGGEDSFEKFTSCDASQTDCIYMDPNNASDDNKDYSSYRIEPVNGSSVYDNLTIRRIRYDDQGHYQALEQVEWYVENKILKRRCKLLRKADGYNHPSDDPCTYGANKTPTPVEMATGVEKFKVYPGIPTIRSNAAAGYQEEQKFPDAGGEMFKLLVRPDDGEVEEATVVNTGSNSTISNFAKNFSDGAIVTGGKQRNELYVAENSDGATSWTDHCATFTLVPGIEYEISFSMAYVSIANTMQQFVAGRDHMAVGFRQTDGDPLMKGEVKLLDDFLFYPPTNDKSQGKRAMRFTVPETITGACMVFTFATYSPVAADGSITISDLKLKQIAGSNYTFDKAKTLLTKDKKNVKALMLELQIARGGKNNQSGETGEATIVVPTPSNGLGD